MKPIDGIDLKELVQKERDDHFQEREEEVLKVIRGVMTNQRSLAFQIDQKQKELQKLLDAKAKVDARIALIEQGNWSVLGDNSKKDEPDNSTK
jgi:hypothetical protein